MVESLAERKYLQELISGKKNQTNQESKFFNLNLVCYMFSTMEFFTVFPFITFMKPAFKHVLEWLNEYLADSPLTAPESEAKASWLPPGGWAPRWLSPSVCVDSTKAPGYHVEGGETFKKSKMVT